MFKLADIKELIKLVDKSSIEELEIEHEGTRIFIRKPGIAANSASLQPSAQPQAAVADAGQPLAQTPADASPVPAQNRPVSEDQTAQETDKLHKITSPMVGTFYEAPAPGAEPFVKIGDRVTEKTVVCIVEAMKLMKEIEAEVKGEIVDVLVENGQLVEFGQPLFLVKLD
jgi:acetyl-CoA carboxylase biotin carboxyl carrier protein